MQHLLVLPNFALLDDNGSYSSKDNASSFLIRALRT